MVATVAPHAKVFDRHSGVKMPARACKVDVMVQGRISESRIGSYGDYCGLEPNQNARYAHRQLVERILAKQRGTKR